MTILAAYMILILLILGGIGVDLMHNEMQRTRMQGVSDRAVLAAADLDQSQDPEGVVRDYFAKSGLADHVSNVRVDDINNSRRVTVAASKTTRTQFMHFLGVPELPVPVASVAEETTRNVEMSLVLDISGSMRFSDRITDLRPAAREFVDLLLADGADQFTSINLIPYAGQTNPGPFMFERLGGVRIPVFPLDEALGGIPETLSHGLLDPQAVGGVGSDPDVRYVFPNVSSCLEMSPGDFNRAGLPLAGADQTPYFMNFPFAPAVMDWGWCPQDRSAIKYLSSNADELKNTINTMRLHDGTGTHYSMKFALGLLDPSSKSHVSALINEGEVEAKFRGRPANYDDDSAVKYIVLMTDGKITQQERPSDPLDTQNPTLHLQNERTSEQIRISQASENVDSFFAQCELAKAASPRPIIVYTIAFEAPGEPERQMRECASSPAHFYAADGENLSDVFEAIARQVKSLRLTN